MPRKDVDYRYFPPKPREKRTSEAQQTTEQMSSVGNEGLKSERTPQQIQLQKARQKIVDYLEAGRPGQQQVVKDVIEREWDNAFLNMLASGATRDIYANQKAEEWATKKTQRRGQIKGYAIEELKFEYEVWKNYWDALRPFVPGFGKRHLRAYHDLKEINRDVEEKTPQTQTQQPL